MANTYTQLYIHCVFAVKYRRAVLETAWDERLRLYITAIVQNNKHKMIAINNMPDHLHLFVGLYPSQSISEMMQLVKGDSSEWINKERLCKQQFHWQEGYGAFSHSKSQIDSVAKYIHNQQEHHKKVTFMSEYRKMLEEFAVDYDERYIFKPLED
jgi:putative transposase